MHVLAAFIITVCLFASFHPVAEKPPGEIDLDVGIQINSPNVIYHDVKPLSAYIDDQVIRQEYDYSCGSAALATLLRFHLGEDLTERQIIRGMMETGDKRKIIDRRAFSLLDMKKFVNRLGYKGVGYKAEMKDLVELDRPCIIPIKLMNYRHFAVLKGVHDGHLFLADPFRGNSSYTLDEFEDMWFENVIFIVYPEDEDHLPIGLQLTNDDLRYIDEFVHEQILEIHRPHIPDPDERINEFTLPEEYIKYYD